MRSGASCIKTAKRDWESIYLIGYSLDLSSNSIPTIWSVNRGQLRFSRLVNEQVQCVLIQLIWRKVVKDLVHILLDAVFRGLTLFSQRRVIVSIPVATSGKPRDGSLFPNCSVQSLLCHAEAHCMYLPLLKRRKWKCTWTQLNCLFVCLRETLLKIVHRGMHFCAKWQNGYFRNSSK